jgi:hypothetical protein
MSPRPVTVTYLDYLKLSRQASDTSKSSGGRSAEGMSAV